MSKSKERENKSNGESVNLSFNNNIGDGIGPNLVYSVSLIASEDEKISSIYASLKVSQNTKKFQKFESTNIYSIRDVDNIISSNKNYKSLFDISIKGKFIEGSISEYISVRITLYCLKSVSTEQLLDELELKLLQLLPYLELYQNISLAIMNCRENLILEKLANTLNGFLLSDKGTKLVNVLNFEGGINKPLLKMFTDFLRKENTSAISISLKDSVYTKNHDFDSEDLENFMNAIKHSNLLGLELIFSSINISYINNGNYKKFFEIVNDHPSLLNINVVLPSNSFSLSIYGSVPVKSVKINMTQHKILKINISHLNYLTSSDLNELHQNPFIKYVSLGYIESECVKYCADSEKIIECNIDDKDFNKKTKENFDKMEETSCFLQGKCSHPIIHFNYINLKEEFFNKSDLLLYISLKLSEGYLSYNLNYESLTKYTANIITLLKYYKEDYLLLNGISKSKILYTYNENNDTVPKVELSEDITQLIMYSYVGLNSINSAISR